MALSGLQCPYGKVVWMYYRHLSNADTWLYPFDVRMKVPFYCDTDTCNADVSLCLFGIHDNEVWLQYSHLCDADTWHCPFGFSGKFVSAETRLSLIFEATFKRKPHEFLTEQKNLTRTLQSAHITFDIFVLFTWNWQTRFNFNFCQRFYNRGMRTLANRKWRIPAE